MATRPVEQIEPGDLIITRDEGPRPVRWTGCRQVRATGDFAPIHIRADTFGAHGDLLLSPQHRVLVRDSLAELLFGEDEVLVAARDLLNDRSVTRRCGGTVTYVHLMFDRHQVIYSAGLPTESFLPGPQTTRLFEQPMVDEICTIFPELDPATGAGYGGAARRTLRRYEAQLLMSRVRAGWGGAGPDRHIRGCPDDRRVTGHRNPIADNPPSASPALLRTITHARATGRCTCRFRRCRVAG